MGHYGWTEDYVRKKITGAKGWVYFNFAQEREAKAWGGSVNYAGKGYVAQEADKQLKYLRDEPQRRNKC